MKHWNNMTPEEREAHARQALQEEVQREIDDLWSKVLNEHKRLTSQSH
jgi:hypothetical protein